MTDCLFCKITNGDIPARRIFENETLVAFHDLHPQAPTHLLIVPKRHIPTLNACGVQDVGLLGEMLLVATHLAHENSFSESGYRLVFNVNSGGGQEIYHIHLHLLGGRQMTWPPG